jgi:hypothetical protein
MLGKEKGYRCCGFKLGKEKGYRCCGFKLGKEKGLQVLWVYAR